MKTLDEMAAGGMYDQLGGGFHRYSVDAVWLVRTSRRCSTTTRCSPRLPPRLARDRRGALPRGRRGDARLPPARDAPPEGGFASAQDADTLGEEGSPTCGRRRDRGPARAGRGGARRCRYGVAGGNFEGANILYVRREVDDPGRLAAARGCSRRAGRGRSRARDDKALAAWNGLALAAFAEAGPPARGPTTPGGRRARRSSCSAGDRRGRASLPHLSGRQAKINGYLEDYANVANGLLELYEATGELRCLEEASRLALLAVDLFDDERGGFFFTPADGEQLVARRKELDDHPTPSGNSMLAFVLLRLARIYGDEELERLAVAVFRLAYRYLERAPAPSDTCSAHSSSTSPRRGRSLSSARRRSGDRGARREALCATHRQPVYPFAEDQAIRRSTRAAPGREGRSSTAGRPRTSASASRAERP